MRERDIFIAALQHDDADNRRAYLEQACGADSGLRDRVQALLGAFDRAGSFLLEPAIAPMATGAFTPPPASGPETTAAPPLERPGSVIGPYKLLEPIGEGGMGAVYMAEQARPVRRKVALKIIKPGMDTRQIVARFEAERQALALMDHPNIARVLDAGATDSGRPYFVMELVRGIPITDYCDAERLSIRGRLEPFIAVCQAVQHAHQKGIIHRDLKPSNVLVTVVDGAAVPKVIDFGVAKAMGQQLTERTLFTAFAQLVGTPLYMSPEQAALSGVDVDTRSDIYSLGVLLYELLTGTTPFDRETLRKAAIDDVRRLIREAEPPKPSTRLSRLGATLATVSANRGADPRRLRKALRGELDWIVMKCLEKDRSRRYETANGLGADVRRYLDHEPVLAGPPSSWYRLRKFARRNRAALATTALVAAALTAVAVVSLIDARRQRHFAAEKTKATARITGLANDLGKERESLRKSLADSNRLLAIRNFDRGQAAFEQDQIASGLLWMIESWRSAVAAGDPAWQHAARANLSAWWPHHHRLRAVFSHPGPATSAAFGPDGDVVLTGGEGTARLWDAATGTPLGPGLQHPGRVLSAALSPDGKTVLTGGEGTARLWDAATGAPLGPPLSHEGSISSVSFRPDGKAALTVSSDGTVRLWDAATGRPLGQLLPHAGAIRGATFSPDGHALLAGGHDSSGLKHAARLWDATTGTPLGPPLPHEEYIMSLALSPDGKVLATGSHDETARLWDAATGTPLGPPLVHQGPVRGVAFRPDGKVLLTASTDKTARLWDAATGAPLGPPLVHQGPVVAVAFRPDGRALLTASSDGTVRLWDADPGPPVGPILEHQGPVAAVAFSPDSKTILTGSLDGMARLWDAATGAPLGPPLLHANPVWAVAFAPDGRTCATGDGPRLVGPECGVVRRWDVATGRPLGPTLPHRRKVEVVAFHPDGKALLTGCQDRTVRLWDAATGAPLGPPLPQPGTVDAGAFGPDGTQFLAGYDIGLAQVRDVATGMPHGPRLPHPGAVSGVAFSPDGKTMLTGCEDGMARLWDAATGQLRHQPLVHQAWVLAVAFSPDGKTVLTGSRDRTARLWDAATGMPLGAPFRHPRGVTDVAFSPDGRAILTANHDTKARIFPNIAELPDELERIAVWVELMTGLTLDAERGSIQALDNAAWLARRQRLRQLGGAPGDAAPRSDAQSPRHEEARRPPEAAARP